MFWFWLGIVIVFDLIGVSFAKKAADGDGNIFLALGIVCFSLVIVFLTQMFRHENFSVGNAVWYGTAMLAVPLIGIFYFHEKLSWPQWIGMGLLCAGILLVELTKK
ncbi:EamA family transporter [bacterium]|jgi:small multidrug resistance pump|nr:EamA family transporter [bacterium]MBT6832043.1 EamA family transporter [bacterium]MBT6995824.1 EamA family transporter [bacterium]MBT7772365.1 EamA family transporter [bacterium]